MKLSEVVALITPITEALDWVGVKYAIGGSVAAIVYGATYQPNGAIREPNDVDMLVHLLPAQTSALVPLLIHHYSPVIGADINNAISAHTSFNLIFNAIPNQWIDIFPALPNKFETDCLNGARLMRIDPANPREFLIMRPEDVVSYKLHHTGNNYTQRDWNDVIQILRTQGRAGISKGRILDGAVHFNITQLGADAIRDAGI